MNVISYRRSLEQFGIPRSERVAYSDFYCRPKSLLKAIESMQPAGNFEQISDNPVEGDWTDAINGCATDGAHWFFTSNQENKGDLTKLGGNNKSLYAFKVGDGVSIGPSCDTFIFQSDYAKSSLPPEVIAGIGGINHIGQPEAFDDKLYISHFNDRSQIIVLQNNDGKISYDHVVDIEVPTSPTNGRTEKVQFQCIVPWDRTFLTCFGSGDIHELFVHNLDNPGRKHGALTGRTIRLQTPISANWWVQGAALSDYGHLFISTSPSKKLQADEWDTVWSIMGLAAELAGLAQGVITSLYSLARGFVAGVFDAAGGFVTGMLGANRRLAAAASNLARRLDLPGENKVDTQFVHIISPLDGKELDVIPVTAVGSWEANYQELEGCCCKPILLRDGRTLEFHVVLSDKKRPALDNFFLKSFQRRS